MPLRLSLRSLTLSIPLLASVAAAQVPQAAKESDGEKAKARKALEQKALALLDETLQGTQALKLAENRAALRARAADLFWSHDEKRARSLFREAVADLASMQGNADLIRDRGWMFTNLRAQLLYAAASHDAQFALVLLRAALLPPPEQRTAVQPSSRGRAAEKPKPLVLEDGDVRDLIDIVTAAASKDTTHGDSLGLLMQLRPLVPEIKKRAPARAVRLRQRLAEVEKSVDPRMKVLAQYDSVRGKPPDAILEEAAKAPEEMRGLLLQTAVMKLMQSGDVERARQVITEQMRGQEREQMLAGMDRFELERAIGKGDTDSARAVAARVKSKERRAAALAELAVAFAAKDDRKSAALLLEEARGLVERQPENEKGIEALLEVARAYALVEPSKTFELIDPLIDQANEMLTAAAPLEKFGAGGGLFRKGEMIISPTLDAAGGPYVRYVKALSELARVDFDRTKTTADRFNRDEARLAARLVVARSVLSDKLDAASVYNGGFGGGGGGGFSSHAVIVSQ